MKGALPFLVLSAMLLAGTPALPGHADAAAQAAGSTRDLYLLLIRQARADGRARAALAYLADFDRQYPGDLEARILTINCLLDLGRIDAASSAVAALPESSAYGEVHAIRGHVLSAQGEWSRAAEQYRAALAANPADPLAGNALGYAQLRAGRAGEAVESLKAAADIAPGNAVIRNNLLLALTLAGRAGEAEAAIRAMPDAAARADLRRKLARQAGPLAAAPEKR